jgi:hypothetical protein
VLLCVPALLLHLQHSVGLLQMLVLGASVQPVLLRLAVPDLLQLLV